MAFLLPAFGWPGVLWEIAILLTLGGVVLGAKPDHPEFVVAKLCLTLALLIFAARIGASLIGSGESLPARLALTGVIFASLGLGWVEGWRWISSREAQQVASVGTAKPVVAPFPPTILAQYTQGALPISVPPQSTIYVLQLNPSIREQTFPITNSRKTVMLWPESPRTPNEFPLGPMYECLLTNHGDKALLDLSITFSLTFLSVEQVFSRRNPDGTVTVGGPRPDNAAFAIGLPNHKTLSGTSGAVISEHIPVATIPAIPARASVSLYIMSQTKFFSKFLFPQTATAIIDGNPMKRLAVLVRPAVSPVDQTKFWILQPSLYERDHVKDQILDDAMPWARRFRKAPKPH